MNFSGTVPLAVITRGGYADNLHRGAVVVCDADGRVLYSAGDPDFVACVRSSCKPIQAIPVIECGATDRYGFNDAEIALMCASHPGAERHVAGVRSMLARAGIPETALKSGAGLTDNCSGKHAGMLAMARFMREPVEGYLEPSHPHQRRILSCFCDMAGLPEEKVGIAVDGCGAPIFFAALRSAARAFARLGTPEVLPAGSRRLAVERIVKAMCAHPDMTGEPDYRAILGGRDVVIGKAGGFGYFAAAVLGTGIGAAVKIEDGGALPHRPVLFEALRRAGAISDGDAGALARALTPRIENRAGREVGKFEIAF
ncbi:MAG: asparaginase [Planctomycetota bacterium]|nr:asparaginase [Planctomycetota bacterium]